MTRRDGHVRVLPLHVANKIAAGEVVERPASVAKELIENAIDADAKNIKLSIAGGGRKLVSVLDDGCGMSRDDALLSLERQATSKILDVGDIEQIDTLGFRGEAIPSIASVSRFSILTRRRESDEGVFLAVNAGMLADVRPAGCPPGTLVEVRDLFCNVPARKKFLRAVATEESHIRNVFTLQALAHRAIGFALWVDGREAYRLASAVSLEERLEGLFGDGCLDKMARIGGEGDAPDAKGVRVYGYVQRPGTVAAGWREQYIFINGRPASAPAVAYAVREAYPRRQGDERPALLLFIDLPPTQVDVNVHPAKREVRFRDNSAVKNAVSAALTAALAVMPGMVPTAHVPTTSAPSTPIPSTPTPSTPTPSTPTFSTPTPSTPYPSTPYPSTPHAPAAHTPQAYEPQALQVEFSVAPGSTASRPWKWFKFLAVTDSGYIISETDAGLIVVHPQAARERIAYEAIVRRESDNAAPVESQTLLLPETVHLPPADSLRIRECLGELASAGFAIEEFGRDIFKIDAVPLVVAELPPAQILASVASDLAASGAKRAGARWKDEAIAKAVAKSFAGMSRAVDAAGAEKLVAELAACRMPYVCPRGRPTVYYISNRELAKKFMRER